VVPLISGTACAIPAIMATRNIENWKERLITILVTPLLHVLRDYLFMLLSSRLSFLILVVGIFNLQGLTLMLLYLLGFEWHIVRLCFEQNNENKGKTSLWSKCPLNCRF
jgi:ferrous iron transport protein B